MEQQGYLRIFRDRWIAIVVGVVVGVWIAAAVGSAIPPTYSATATLFLSVQSDAGSLNERSQFALARITSYPELVHSADVLGKTISDLGLNETVQQLSSSITAANPPTTVLLQITADARSADQAAAIANSVATNLASAVDALENSPTDKRYSVNLEPRIPAQPPAGTSAPQMSIILGLGGISGLALGLIAAILWSRFDTSIRTVAQVRRVSGLPVLGELPRLSGPFVSGARALARREGSFREAQLTIRQANAAVVPDVLLLVPASRTSGGLAVRVGFARAFSATGRAVCLVEGAFDGGIESIVPAANRAQGLAEALDSGTAVKRLVMPVEGEQFSLLPAGDAEDLPKEYDAERRIRGAVRDLVSMFDVTIVQATSTTRPVSLELVTPYADGVVVLVRPRRTRSAELARLLSRLRLMGVRPLGIVLTGVPVFRQSDLAAGWLPGDFNEVRRTRVASLDDPAAATPAQPRRAPRKPRAIVSRAATHEAPEPTDLLEPEQPAGDLPAPAEDQPTATTATDSDFRETSSVN
jgi:capsular polysaccharide biosynthesis protein/Mrp family chromosome partitioning ATPase